MGKLKWLILGTGAICAAAAFAQAPMRSLDRCMAITDPSARLSCYDNALARPAPKPQPGEASGVPAPSMTSPQVVARSQLSVRPAAPKAAPTPSTIDGRITAIVPIGGDLFRFQLSDGSVWRTGEQAQTQPAVGEMVRIRRTPLTFYATIGGRAAIGIRRVR